MFLAGHPGSYTATWSTLNQDDVGDHFINIYLRKNNKAIDVARHYSRFDGENGQVQEMGGRTLVIHLDRGDTLDLYCDECSAAIYDTIFCVSLSQFDVI